MHVAQVCQTELFTDVAEEKEVAQIGAKVKEAKATKSFRIYQLLGTLASQDSLPGLTGPLCEVSPLGKAAAACCGPFLDDRV